MIKSIIKEIFIIILLVIAIILTLGIVFYDYRPSNKKIPSKVAEYTLSEEMSEEKHVPIVTKTQDGVEIKVGQAPHPMEDSHYIMFIEANSADKKYVKRKYLLPHEEPVLKLKCDCKEVVARELCNIHGVWISEKQE